MTVLSRETSRSAISASTRTASGTDLPFAATFQGRRIFRTLDDCDTAALFGRHQTGSALIKGARQKHSNHPRAVRCRRRPKQWIDSRAMSVLASSPGHMNMVLVEQRFPISKVAFQDQYHFCSIHISRSEGAPSSIASLAD